MGKNVKKSDTDKDKGYRERLAICNKVVGELVSKLLEGDNSYLTTRCVSARTMAVKKAKNQLLDPRFMLQWLRKLMQPIIAENISSSVGVQDAFQALESYLTRYANPVQKKQSAKHLPDSISLTASQKEMMVQPAATVDQTQQLITEDKLFSLVKTIVNEVLGPYLGRPQNQKLTNPVSIHGDPESSKGAKIHNIQGYHEVDSPAKGLNVDPSHLSLRFREMEKLLLSDNKIPDDLGEGTSDARANQHNMELSQENIFTVDTVLPSPLCFPDMENFGDFRLCDLSDNKIPDDLGEGTSDARANQHNMKLSQENTFTVDPVLPSPLCFSDMENFGDFGLCDLSDNKIPDGLGEGTSDARANQHNMKLSQENNFTAEGCADIQNSQKSRPVMHDLTKKSAKAKGKRSVKEINDEAYIKKGKMKLVNDS